MNVYVKDEYLRALESDVEDLRDSVAELERELAMAEALHASADRALVAAWDLMRPEAREELVRLNCYAEEMFWNEPR